MPAKKRSTRRQPSHCYFVHHKPHVDCPGTEFWTRDDRQGTNLLSNDTTLRLLAHILQCIRQCSIVPLGKLMNFLFQSRNSPHFTLPEDSLPSLQEAIAGRFSEPRVSFNIRPPYYLKGHYNFTLI